MKISFYLMYFCILNVQTCVIYTRKLKEEYFFSYSFKIEVRLKGFLSTETFQLAHCLPTPG
jgi:hypothetical protein